METNNQILKDSASELKQPVIGPMVSVPLPAATGNDIGTDGDGERPGEDPQDTLAELREQNRQLCRQIMQLEEDPKNTKPQDEDPKVVLKNLLEHNRQLCTEVLQNDEPKKAKEPFLLIRSKDDKMLKYMEKEQMRYPHCDGKTLIMYLENGKLAMTPEVEGMNS